MQASTAAGYHAPMDQVPGLCSGLCFWAWTVGFPMPLPVRPLLHCPAALPTPMMLMHTGSTYVRAADSDKAVFLAYL